jgi:hypothetical protein
MRKQPDSGIQALRSWHERSEWFGIGILPHNE